MLTLGSIGFAVPAALLGLLTLPVLWWLLRATPPAPLRRAFPPIRFLLELTAREETVARTPLWLVLLRMLLATAIVFGAAHPTLYPSHHLGGSGPLVILVDTGWSAAKAWLQKRATLLDLIDAADRESRPVILLSTAPPPEMPRAAVAVLTAGQARAHALELEPRPWTASRVSAVAQLEPLVQAGVVKDAGVFFLSDGLEHIDEASEQRDIVTELRRFGPLTIFTPRPADLPVVLRPAVSPARSDQLIVVRPSPAATSAPATLLLSTDDDQPLQRRSLAWKIGERGAIVELDLSPEWRSRVAQMTVLGEDHAGAVMLIDSRSQQRTVGLVMSPGQVQDQPLLTAAHYLRQAVEPYAELRAGPVPSLLEWTPSVMIAADEGRFEEKTASSILNWVRRGGLLVRFAGPRLVESASGGDKLLPARLHPGDRTIGGALSWERPGQLAPFDMNGPFRGLEVARDVEVWRQVLVEPSQEGQAVVWARLLDGTPLVSARSEGEGWLVLVHTTADPSWSNLVLSGMFVDMMSRLIDLSRGFTPVEGDRPLPPLATIDGFGRLGPPAAHARPIAAGAFAQSRPGPQHPPGFYGTMRSRHAMNLGTSLADPTPLPVPGADVITAPYGGTSAIDLRPWLLGAGLFLCLLDMCLSIFLRGLVKARAGRMPLAGKHILAASLLVVASVSSSAAQSVVSNGSTPSSAVTVSLAYFRTGDPAADEISRSGLAGLSAVINRRTAAELAEPTGVDPATDELAFYPLLYWPIDVPPKPLSEGSRERLKAYMRSGGTILFDSRSHGPSRHRLDFRALAAELDLPPLVPLPEDHLLRRSYYLLTELPGRFSGETVWVAKADAANNDGVPVAIAGSHDWVGAWAVDDSQRPVLAVVPGGERQRELAYRFGVNLVMHLLTGSYKADQVHLQAIIERLGR